jgi:heme exporter protein D
MNVDPLGNAPQISFSRSEASSVMTGTFAAFVSAMAISIILVAIALAKNVESKPATPLDSNNKETITGCLGTVVALSGASIITAIVLAILHNKRIAHHVHRALDAHQQYQRMRMSRR